MFSDGGMLWRAFLNGMLDVIPPMARFIDGNENYGYQAMADEGDFRADTWYILQTLRNGAVIIKEKRGEKGNIFGIINGKLNKSLCAEPY
jgi:hypothetical protein